MLQFRDDSLRQLPSIVYASATFLSH